jgi:EmrB/QacA subfamily drug resistance transporter
LALALLAVADFVVILDGTIVNVALPSIGTHLHASTSALSWVISAYVLAFGGLLLLGGRLADLFGRRRLFIAGLIVFGLASLAAGLSRSIGELIALRAVQGVGAAALAPAARSIITTLFEEGAERAKAMGIWAAVAGSGSVVGLVLGGVLTSTLGWSWVLFVNVPVTLLAAAIAPRLISESRSESAERSIDITGAVLVSVGLLAALYALVNANSAGWGSAQTVGLLGLGVVLLTAFAWVEGKVRSPLVALGIFHNAQVRGANIAMALMAAAMIGMFFVLSLYQQDLQGYSALKAGLSGLPLGVALITVAGLAGPAIERIGARPVLLAGLAVFTAGVTWLSRIPVHGSYLTDVLGPSLVIAVGLGLAFVAVTIAAADGIDSQHAGLAGGLINMTQQVGGAVGLAVITAVATSHIHPGVHSAAAVNDGFRAALLLAAGIAGAAVLITAVVLPGRRSRRAASGAPIPALAV